MSSVLRWLEEQHQLKLLNATDDPNADSNKLWTRCEKCYVLIYVRHLEENKRVCFNCGFHVQLSSQERIDSLIDTGTWQPLDENLSPCDPLKFKDQRAYTIRLKEAQKRTKIQDAVQTGTGLIDGIPLALGVMNFGFMGGSMGSVVGEKITRLIEYATQEGLPLVLISASGGARMQEGIFSLMQMAKISAALNVHQSSANLLYISVLTAPTTGGVTASFAMLGDLIISEPKALIGFAGKRVIEQTLQEKLPNDFQTAEYLQRHGLVDLILPRIYFRQGLAEILAFYKDASFKTSGFLPYGIQPPYSSTTEEKVRRKWKKQSDKFQKFISKDNNFENLVSLTPNKYSTFPYNDFSYNECSYRNILMSFETLLTNFPEEISNNKTINFLDKAISIATKESFEWFTSYTFSINKEIKTNYLNKLMTEKNLKGKLIYRTNRQKK